MYEFIDESLYAILSESEDPTLSQYAIFYYGEDIPKDVSKYIKILLAILHNIIYSEVSSKIEKGSTNEYTTRDHEVF